MMWKRLKQLVIGSAIVPAALAVGSSASAEAATGNSSGQSSTVAPLVTERGGSAGAMNHVRDSWIHDLYLTDHEQYVRHHERLASKS
jgi:hypothetical protein